METNGPDRRPRALFRGSLRRVDRAAFVPGLRIAALASLGVILVVALAVTVYEVVRYMGRDQHVFVIGDEPMAAGASGLHPVSIEDKWGYIDSAGVVRIQPQFDSAFPFSEGLARVALVDNGATKQGYIDTSGAIVIRPRFGYAEDFSDGMAVVGEAAHEGKPRVCGYISTSGNLAIPMQHAYAVRFREGLAVVRTEDGSSLFVDKTGATALGPYDFAMSFSEGLAYVKKGGTQGFITKKGDWAVVLESAVLDMSSYLSGVAPFPRSCQGFSEGLMGLQSTLGTSPPVMGGADKGYIDSTGAWVIEPQFNHACDFSEGLAAVCAGGKWGYVDKTGAWVIHPQFDYTRRFAEGLAVVGVTEGGYMRFGYVDRTGSPVIPTQYAQAGDFSGGVAQVVVWANAHSSGLPSYIDKTGKMVWQAR